MPKKKESREKKEPIPFHLEKSIIARIQEIVNNPNSIFENRSNLIRYCIKQQLTQIEKDLLDNENEQNV